MKRSQRHAAVCAWALAGLVASVPGYAQQSSAPEATRFEFRAPAGCGSAQDFSSRVSRRSWRIKLVAAGSARRSLVVEIQQGSGSSLRGTVTVTEADGTTRTRRLKAASCAEAVDALSLIATVTLDPDAVTGDAPPEPAKPPDAPKPPETTPQPTPRPPAPPSHRELPSEPYRFSFGLAATLLVRMAPELVPGGTASAAFELNPGHVTAPLLRLSLTHAQRRGLTQQGGQASFAFTLPTLDLCPVRLGPRALGVRPCAFGSVGLLKVWGEATRQNETHARVHGSAGVAAWALLRTNEVFEIIAEGRVGLPFRADEFAFDRQVFFKTPTPGFSFGLGAAGGFP